MRVLLVEDEPGISQFIYQGLSEAGYAVDAVFDGKKGLDYAFAAEYDALILDVLLPEVNGLSLLARLRLQGSKVPVLLLTALDAVEDRVKGLNAGADDYLVKPFAFSELLARIQALLRRPPLQVETILRVGKLEMNTAKREVRRAGQIIELSQREFTLLEYFMRHPSQVLTRTQIAEHVWNFNFFNESNVVDVYIGYLRRKLDWGFSCSFIQTLRGVGYRLNPEIEDA